MSTTEATEQSEIEPFSTPATPAEWNARLGAAVFYATGIARTHLQAAIQSARGTLQGMLNDSTGDVTRPPQIREQLLIDDACFELATKMSTIFRNLS